LFAEEGARVLVAGVDLSKVQWRQTTGHLQFWPQHPVQEIAGRIEHLDLSPEQGLL